MPQLLRRVDCERLPRSFQFVRGYDFELTHGADVDELRLEIGDALLLHCDVFFFTLIHRKALPPRAFLRARRGHCATNGDFTEPVQERAVRNRLFKRQPRRQIVRTDPAERRCARHSELGHGEGVHLPQRVELLNHYVGQVKGSVEEKPRLVRRRPVVARLHGELLDSTLPALQRRELRVHLLRLDRSQGVEVQRLAILVEVNEPAVQKEGDGRVGGVDVCERHLARRHLDRAIEWVAEGEEGGASVNPNFLQTLRAQGDRGTSRERPRAAHVEACAHPKHCLGADDLVLHARPSSHRLEVVTKLDDEPLRVDADEGEGAEGGEVVRLGALRNAEIAAAIALSELVAKRAVQRGRGQRRRDWVARTDPTERLRPNLAQRAECDLLETPVALEHVERGQRQHVRPVELQ